MSKSLSTLKTFAHAGQSVAYHELAALQALRGAPTPCRVAMPPARRAPHETEDVS